MGWNFTFISLLLATYNRDYNFQHTIDRNGNKLGGNNQNYYLNDNGTHIFTNDNEPKILIIEPLEGDIDKYNKNGALKDSLIDEMVFTTCNIDYYLPCNVREIELISNSLSLNNIISKIANRESYFIIDNDNNKQYTCINCLLETFHEIYFNGEYEIMFMRSRIKVINDGSCTTESNVNNINDTHDSCYAYTIDISFDKHYTFLFADAPITNKYPNDFNGQTVYTFKQNIFHHLGNAEGTEFNDTDVMAQIVILNKDIAVINGRCSESNNVLDILVLLLINNHLINHLCVATAILRYVHFVQIYTLKIL